MKPYEVLTCLTVTKEDLTNHPEFEKFYNPFIINRFISMNPQFSNLVEYININMPKSAHYRFLLKMLPQKKIYFKWYKKDKELNAEEKEAIKTYFQINEDRCNEIIELLDDKTLKSIIDAIGGKIKRTRKKNK